MCVQFMIEADVKKLERLYGAVTPVPFIWKPHVFPRYITPVITLSGKQFEIRPMHFGLIPFFERAEKPKSVFHNARAESVREKPSFARPFQERRCIIPIESFFEYFKSAGKKAVLGRVTPKDAQLLHGAAIWNRWKSPSGVELDTVALITTEPPASIRDAGHDRCPLFLQPSSLESWCSGPTDEAATLLSVPVPDGFTVTLRERAAN